MYKVRTSSRFRKDYARVHHRGYNMSLLENVVRMLAEGTPLPEKYRDHELSGNWAGKRECHITPDWLLVYYKENDILTLTLTRTGTHSDLF